MADIPLDPQDVSADGLSLPIADFKGKRPAAGQVVTVGKDVGDPTQWEVLRVDRDEGMLHLVRTDRATALRKDHVKRGLKADGSLEVS